MYNNTITQWTKHMQHKETQGFTCMSLLHYSESIVFSQKINYKNSPMLC